MSPNDTYISPLAQRNASKEMLRIWSPRHKFGLWRRIWLAVAEAQNEMGLPVTEEQVAELRAHLEVTDEDIRRAEEHERRLRHDVMAHVHALGEVCPKARPIIHLGMTSEDVGSNADLLIIGQAMRLVSVKIARVILAMGDAAARTSAVPTLGFTHYQPAQPVTVGRRLAGWAADLSIAHHRVTVYEKWWRVRGLRGATGTQASYLELFDGDSTRAVELDRLVSARLIGHLLGRETSHQFVERYRAGAQDRLAKAQAKGRMGKAVDGNWARAETTLPLEPWEHIERTTYALSGQTYPRVVDTFVLADLASTASVLHKIATDIRLLSNRKELDEPFEAEQIGSSAMPYKRNPMRCERICGLARFVMNLVGNAYDTAATQWLERTLDDSSNRRLSLPEALLALDGALDLMHNVASGLVVNEATVRANLMAELPFMATENLMMAAVKLGRDRQDVHEAIRRHAQEAGFRVKQEGKPNDLIERLRNEPLLAGVDFSDVLDPMKYVGRAPEQVDRFLKEVVEPLREQYGERIASLGETGPRV